MSRRRISRRELLKQGAAATTAFAFPPVVHAFGVEKLRIAVVGTANQAAWNLNQIAGEQIVALCDVDATYLEAARQKFPDARGFRDFREMLNASLDIDAVLIATPDHIHAPAAALALRRGKHVYCEKPLAHTVEEVRLLSRLASEKKLATQMGTQIHAGANYRRTVELIRSGVIGRVRQVHVWCDKAWSGERYGESKPPPANLDWDLWLGPAPEHAYSDGIHPGQWRRFWDYGAGTLGDMACHHLDLAYWALGLRHPATVRAEGPPPNDVGAPDWLIVRYEFAAEGERPAVEVTWYDGGKRPAQLAGLKKRDGAPLEWGGGSLFVGETGVVIADCERHVLVRDNVVVEFTPPPPTIPDSIGHHAEWLKACRTGSPATCNFDYAGALTEAVQLGVVAFRAGKKLEWHAADLRVAGGSDAQQLLRATYRKGWEL